MPSVAYKMANENRRELSPIFSPQFNKNYQAFKALLSIYHNTNVFCLMSCVLCLVFKISHPISHISYLISQIYLLPLSFVSRSDLLRTLFGAASENTRTRSEQGPNERGLRVEGEWKESGTRVKKKPPFLNGGSYL